MSAPIPEDEPDDDVMLFINVTLSTASTASVDKRRQSAPRQQPLHPAKKRKLDPHPVDASLQNRKRHKCTVCDKQFSRFINLVRHRRVHSGEKPFECTVCGKRFTQKANLVQHSRVHSGEKPFECTVCGKRFTRKANLVRHSRVHSGR